VPDFNAPRYVSPAFTVGPDPSFPDELPITVEWRDASNDQEPAEPAEDDSVRRERAGAVWRTEGERRAEESLVAVARNMALVPAQRAPTVLLNHMELGRPIDRRLWLLSEPTSPQAEAYRLLRHRLLVQADPRIVVVTSAMPGEGKTTCAANLALAMAEESTASVLLFDANLRRPAARRLFGIPHLDGVLDGVEIRTYPVVALAGLRLRVCSALNDPGTNVRIDRAALRMAMADLAYAYDYIVVDASSVLEGSEVNLLAEVVDGVLLAARAGSSHRQRLRRALARLGSVTILGAVLVDS